LAASKTCSAEGEAIIAAARDQALRLWPERLVAAYALGSLAHGGFSAASDVDLGLLIADPLQPSDAERIAELAAAVRATGKPFADRLSVFWGSVDSLRCGSRAGRFPPLDRLDLIKFGRLLAGNDVRGKLAAPTTEELVVAGAEFALSRLGTPEVIAKLKDPATLLRSDAKTLTKLLLYPLRFLFTARTGEVGRNDAAVAHFASRADDAATRLARMALQWRNTPPAPSDASALEAIRTGAVPLYDEFLRDHEARLQAYRRPELAAAFAQWREALHG
jgi:hypothetical protein